MDKKLFDDAIGEVPPSTVDVDAAIARGRRAAWTRRVLSPVTAVAAGVVLVAGGAVALTLPSDDPVTAAQIQPTSTTQATTQPEPGLPTGTCLPRPDGAEAQRLTEALAAALEARGMLMDAALTGDKPLTFVGLYPAPDATSGCLSLYASADVNDTGELSVAIGTAKESPPAEPQVTDTEIEGGVRVDILRTDGTAITLTSTGTPLPLTVEQLTEVGLDAGLTIN